MRSLATTTAIADPHRAAQLAPDGDIGARLQRLCALLGIAGARLSHVGADGLLEVVAFGPDANLTALETRAAAATQPTVIADTAQPAARFYVGLMLPSGTDCAPHMLSLFDPQPRSPMLATTIAALAAEVLAQAALARQSRQIAAQKLTIADYAAVEEQRRSLFDRASATARIGIWQCNLVDNSVTWTNGVYDLFEIPRNTPVTRASTLSCYTPASRQLMEAARAAAIVSCSDFSVDCEIITFTGKRRWMRLTGAVESRDGVAHRIFGMKQDITEEKLLADHTRYLAEFDVMTGLANRAQFQARLARLDDGSDDIGALLLVDLDSFKQINDTYGHAMGDASLKEAARRLLESCGDAELVARIGGDEFAVLLVPGTDAAQVEALADDIVRMMRQSAPQLDATLRLGASVGVAHYRGGGSEVLFRKADMALYAAKAAGRDTRRTFAD